jgi:hypothetical protein
MADRSIRLPNGEVMSWPPECNGIINSYLGEMANVAGVRVEPRDRLLEDCRAEFYLQLDAEISKHAVKPADLSPIQWARGGRRQRRETIPADVLTDTRIVALENLIRRIEQETQHGPIFEEDRVPE